MRRAAALADQSDPPASAADPFLGIDPVRRRRRGGAADPPARAGGGGGGQRLLVRAPPAPEQQRRRAAILGGELEAARGRHRRPPRLADHRREAAVPHPFLHHRQHLVVVPAFGVEQAIRPQPRQSERGGEEIAAGERPEHLPPAAREARGGGGEKKRGRGIVIERGRSGRRFVQRHRQPAPGKPHIHLPDPERHVRRSPGGRAGTLDGANLGAQGVEAGGRSGHATRTCLFMLCSI